MNTNSLLFLLLVLLFFFRAFLLLFLIEVWIGFCFFKHFFLLFSNWGLDWVLFFLFFCFF
jgi:hypothetical protein